MSDSVCDPKLSLELLTTDGCSLCQKAIDVMAQVIDLTDVNAEVAVFAVDIAESEAMVDRYGLRIPVIREEKSGQELDWPFDQGQFLSFINSFLVTQR